MYTHNLHGKKGDPRINLNLQGVEYFLHEYITERAKGTHFAIDNLVSTKKSRFRLSTLAVA